MLISLSNESFVTRGYSIKRFRDIRISFALKIRMKNSRSQKKRVRIEWQQAAIVVHFF